MAGARVRGCGPEWARRPWHRRELGELWSWKRQRGVRACADATGAWVVGSGRGMRDAHNVPCGSIGAANRGQRGNRRPMREGCPIVRAWRGQYCTRRSVAAAWHPGRGRRGEADREPDGTRDPSIAPAHGAWARSHGHTASRSHPCADRSGSGGYGRESVHGATEVDFVWSEGWWSRSMAVRFTHRPARSRPIGGAMQYLRRRDYASSGPHVAGWPRHLRQCSIHLAHALAGMAGT